MLYTYRHIFLLVTLAVNICQSANICNNTVWMRIELNGIILKPIIRNLVVSSLLKCAEECLYEALCKSFGIHQTSMICQLYEDRIWKRRRLFHNLEPYWFYYWALEAACPVWLGYIFNSENRTCHKFYNNTVAKTWFDALDHCQSEAGLLLMADVPAKKDILTGINPEASADWIIIGGASRYKNDDKKWQWMNGVQINLTEFANGRPDSHTSSRFCLAYTTTIMPAAFYDLSCLKTSASYICEVPLKPRLIN